MAVVCLLVLLPPVYGNVLIQRTITIDGDMSDWEQAPNILTNPGQFSEDASGDDCDPNDLQPGDDLDCAAIQSTGRDLKKFAFTFDQDHLFMLVERYASENNVTSWLFYLDINNSGLMEATDKVLLVRWWGSNRDTDIRLYDYVPDDPAGDPLVQENIFCEPGSAFPEACEETGDGYTMPGSITNRTDLESFKGGEPGGLRMETRVAWTALDPNAAGPFSVGFHISSSRGDNLPRQVEDNMDGPRGAGGEPSTLIFADAYLAKTGPANLIGLSGQPVAFTLTLGNHGPDAATNIEVTDDCEANGFDSFHSAEASAGSYDPGTGVWSVAEVDVGETETLILRCLIEVEATTERINTASITALGVADPDLDNNADSVTIDVIPVPELTLLKFSAVTRDPVNGSNQPKRIPGAWVTYTVKVVNSGFGNAETVEVADLLPASVTLYTGDFAGSGQGPVSFTAGNSGLAYSYPDDLVLLDDNDDPVTPNGGFDPAVARIKVAPQGTFWGQEDSPTGDAVHEFELRFRVRVD